MCLKTLCTMMLWRGGSSGRRTHLLIRHTSVMERSIGYEQIAVYFWASSCHSGIILCVIARDALVHRVISAVKWGVGTMIAWIDVSA